MSTKTCDGCGKERGDVRTVARDANGDPDVGLCFPCRKEAARRARKPAYDVSDDDHPAQDRR